MVTEMDIKEFATYALEGLEAHASRLFEMAVNDPEYRDVLIAEYNALAPKAEYLKALIAG